MNAMMAIELLNGNFFLENQNIEVNIDEFTFLKDLSPQQMWIIVKQLKPENVTNPSFDWASHIESQKEFENNLKTKWKHSWNQQQPTKDY